MASHRNCCISFKVFLFSCFRFPRYSPISFHLLLYSSASLNPTNGACALSCLFCSGRHSTPIPYIVDSIDSSRSSPPSCSDSPSHCGYHQRPSGPPFSLPEMCFTSKSNSRIHAILRVTSAPGRSLAGKLSLCTNALVSVSTRNLTPYT